MPIDLGATRVLECAGCDGLWIDAEVFEALCANREAQAAVLHRLEARTPAPSSAVVKYRPCLRCGTMMNRVNFGRLSGTVVDTCRGHGTFLDAGELHGIIGFIRGGGLERARERQIEDLKDEQRRLRDQQATDLRRSGERDGTRPTQVFSWGAGDIAEILKALKR
jgi:Zn-finger nucleic acid-binding protein